MKRSIEITTIVGCILGVGAVLGAMFFKKVSLSNFANPAALIVIFGGTAASLFNAFPGSILKKMGTMFKLAFTSRKSNAIQTVTYLGEFAEQARREGLLAIEAKLDSVEDPFMKKALGLIVDGYQAETIEAILESEMDAVKERHEMHASIFQQACTYAPTLGVLGAVFGLIAALGHIDDTEEMSHAISAAFMATILGIFTGYVLWGPFANKLKTGSKLELAEMEIVLVGVMAIYAGDNPGMVRDKMKSLLSKKDQNKLDAIKAGG